MGYYVYKYEYKDEVIYVGKTDYDLKGRIECHSKEYKFQPYLSDVKILYYECKNPAHTTILETYYINKYKPKLNVSMKYDDDLDLAINEVEWKPIDDFDWAQDSHIKKPLISRHCNIAYFDKRFALIKMLDQRIKAIYYFYLLYKREAKNVSSYMIYNIGGVKSNDCASELISKYSVPLYYKNDDESWSYHPTIHHCKYNPEKQMLSFWINYNLYRDNFAKVAKDILRDNRQRYKDEINALAIEIRNHIEDFQAFESKLCKWKQYFNIIKEEE